VPELPSATAPNRAAVTRGNLLTERCVRAGRILTACNDTTARLWDRDGTPLATLHGHTEAVNGPLFAPDGSRILTVSNDGTARLWGRDGESLAILQGHTMRLNDAGARREILTASKDNTRGFGTVTARRSRPSGATGNGSTARPGRSRGDPRNQECGGPQAFAMLFHTRARTVVSLAAVH
jgi:hypothetical protein